MSDHTRHIVHRFVEGVLAPVFVAAIGLRVNFLESFQLDLVLAVLVVGMGSKVLGCALAARLAGLGRPEAWAVGWTLNARGELGIILGLLAWQAGLIGQPLFVALVILAIVSSAMAGPLPARVSSARAADQPFQLAGSRPLPVRQAGGNPRRADPQPGALDRETLRARSRGLPRSRGTPRGRRLDLARSWHLGPACPYRRVESARWSPSAWPRQTLEISGFRGRTPSPLVPDPHARGQLHGPGSHPEHHRRAREGPRSSRTHPGVAIDLELLAALRIGEILTRPHVRPRSRQQPEKPPRATRHESARARHRQRRATSRWPLHGWALPG